MIWLVYAAVAWGALVQPGVIIRDGDHSPGIALVLFDAVASGVGAVLFFYLLARGFTQLGVLS